MSVATIAAQPALAERRSVPISIHHRLWMTKKRTNLWLRLLLFGPAIFRAKQIEFELRLVARAGNLDGQNGGRSFLLKERVHSFQEKRFDTCLGLRELRLHSQSAA